MPSLVPCIAPWHAILVKWHGGVFPDSQFQGGYGNLKNHTLAEIWRSPEARALRQSMIRGEMPPACAQCSLKEASVGHSRRFFFRDVVEPWIDQMPDDPDAEPDIRFLEINTSNLCNLKCVMCSGAISTAWIKDEQILKAKQVDYPRPDTSKVVWQEWDPKWLKNLFANPEHFRNLQYLSLKGGEPFLDTRNIDVLRFFIDNGMAKNISVEITTNGTIINEPMLDLISKYKLLNLHISVEATGDLYRWIRGGDNFGFSDLEKNIIRLSRIPNAEILITTLAMGVNLWNLSELKDWVISLTNIHGASFRNIVINPRYLDPHLIPRDMRLSALNISKPSASLDKFEKCYGNTGFLHMIKSLAEETMTTEESEIQRNYFRSFVNDLDLIRGTNLVKIVPELKEIL